MKWLLLYFWFLVIWLQEPWKDLYDWLFEGVPDL